MRRLIDEFRAGLRGLARSPGFALTAIAVLALGIGANTAVFSVVNSLLLTEPPFREPEDLVVITARSEDPSIFPGMSLADFEDIRTTTRELEDVAFLSWTVGYNLSGGGTPERVTGAWVSHNLFDMLGTRPIIGRTFQPADDRPGATGTVVLTNALWQSRFGGDRSMLGRSITLDGRAFEIIGVMPGSFRVGANAGLWLPVNVAMPDARRLDRSARLRTLALGRLRNGATADAANRELADIADRLAAMHPESNANVSASAMDFERWNSGEFVGPARILIGVVAFVLLIACANLANLLLARMPARRHEMAVRASIGASRLRLFRLLLLESLALASLAGVAGLLLAWWGVGVMNGVLPGAWTAGRVDAFAIDFRVLAFTAGISVLTALAFGIVPAMRLSRVSLQDVMKKGSTRSGGSGGRLRGALVVAETALALILLVAAGTLLRSFVSFRSLDLGFDPSSTLTFAADRAGGALVAIVNESLAGHYWPGGSAIGREIRLGENESAHRYTVVGVIGDVRQPAHTELTIIPNSVYLPIAQNPARSLLFYARTGPSAGALARALPALVASIDPEQPVTRIRTLEQIVSTEAFDRAMMTSMLGLFGAVGLALALIGIYGVMSYAVASRTREIAIRMGLGARAIDMRRLIVGDGARLLAIGVAAGLAGSWAAMRALSASIEFIEAIDPVIIGIVAILLAATALLACWLPARRAMRVQPMDVLRYD